MAAERRCDQPGCERPLWARGKCSTHYQSIFRRVKRAAYRAAHPRPLKRDQAIVNRMEIQPGNPEVTALLRGIPRRQLVAYCDWLRRKDRPPRAW